MLLELLVIAPPVLLLVFAIMGGAMATLGLPIPRSLSQAAKVLVLSNFLELCILGIHLYREYLKGDDDSWVFWGGMLTHYFSLGGALYYLCHLRGWLLKGRSHESFRAFFRSRFLNSRGTHIVRLANRLWVPLSLVFLLLAIIIPFPQQWDFLFEVFIRMCAATFTIGGAASLYFIGILLCDAAIRWQGSVAEKITAKEIYSSFYLPEAADKYFRAVSAAEASREI